MKKTLFVASLLFCLLPSISKAVTFNVNTGKSLSVFSGKSINVFINSAVVAGLIDKSECNIITLGSGVSSNTATLGSSYDTTRSSLFFEGSDSDTSTMTSSSTNASIDLTNSTTVTATRGGGAATTVTLKVAYCVAQWSVGVIKSIQRVNTVIQAGATSSTSPITSVTTANAFINTLGENATTSTAMFSSQWARVDLTNSTTVTATRGASGTDGITASSQITEFNAGYVNSIQQCDITIANTAASSTCALSPSVTTTESMVFYGGSNCNTTTFQACMFQLNLSNGNALTARRFGTSQTSVTTGTVVDFNPAYLNSNVQSCSISIASALTNTATLSPGVSTTKSLLSYLGLADNNNGAVNANNTLQYLQLTNGTTITATRGGNSALISSSTCSIMESK